MTTSTSQEPTKPGAGALARGFVASAAIGAGLACIVVGAVIAEGYVAILGPVLIVAAIVVTMVWRRLARGPRPPRPEPRLALARIENRRAQSSESGDIPLEFVVTIAPDDAPAFRTKFTQYVNLVDLPDYKPRGIIVVEYRPDRPWDVKIITEPNDAWARRAAEESIDSAPESTMNTAANESCTGFCLITVVGFLLGAAAVVFAFRGDLFDDDGPSRTPASTVTSTSSSSSSTSTTITGEVMLLPGEMRKAVEELIALAGTDKAVDFSIDESFMSLDAAKPSDPRLVDSFEFRNGEAEREGPRGTRSATADEPLIDLRAIPYERLVQLVFEAKTTLGINASKSWHISFDHDPVTREFEIRVSVHDEYGAASLTTDANGTVTERTPR